MTDRARIVGLTGGIGAGKSEVLDVFGRLGAATISSDAVVHDLLAGPEVTRRIAERWGEDVAPDGELDRVRIAHVVFERPEELAWLERELHPLVGERIAAWATSLGPGMLGVAEVPLLFETAMQDAFDAVVSVVSDDRVRSERATARGQGGLEGREERQLPQEEKARRADFVIENDGTLEELEAKVAALIPRLRAAELDR